MFLIPINLREVSQNLRFLIDDSCNAGLVIIHLTCDWCSVPSVTMQLIKNDVFDYESLKLVCMGPARFPDLLN